MKNFEMQCPVDGTSALQPEFQHASVAGAIIEFPGRPSRTVPAPSHAAARQMPGGARRTRSHVIGAEMVQALRCGSIDGRAYGRVRPWQGAVAGCIFSALAFASLLIGL